MKLLRPLATLVLAALLSQACGSPTTTSDVVSDGTGAERAFAPRRRPGMQSRATRWPPPP